MDSRKIRIRSETKEMCGVRELHYNIVVADGYKGHVCLLDDVDIEFMEKMQRLLGGIISEYEKYQFQKIRSECEKTP